MLIVEDEIEGIEFSIFPVDTAEFSDIALLIFSDKYLFTFSQQGFATSQSSDVRIAFVSQTKQLVIEHCFFPLATTKKMHKIFIGIIEENLFLNDK